MPKTDLGRSLFIIILIVITIVFAIVLNTNTAAPVAGNRTGTLYGNVTIGPLCPVEPCTIPPDRIAAAYAARHIFVSTLEGTVVAEVVPDPHNGYSVVLQPGSYVVDIRHEGIGGSRNLPKTVTIHSGETVRLDIDIDTGIR